MYKMKIIQNKEGNQILLFTVTVQVLVGVELVKLIRGKQGVRHLSIEEQNEHINHLDFMLVF